MTKLDDDLAKLTGLIGTIGSEVDKISTDTDTLLAQIAAFPTASLTPEQQAALDAIVASAQSISDKVTALDAKVPDPAAPTA